MTEPEGCQEHSIVEDLIDITPDKSQTIYYCEVCFMWFESLCGDCQ